MSIRNHYRLHRIHAHQRVHHMEDLILKFMRKVANRTSRVDNLLPPVLSLARDVCRQDDFDRRIYKEQR